MTDQKIPTPVEVETAMLEKQAHPLDAQAGMFNLYLPRFQGQLNFMSKKQLVLLMTSLANSIHNKPEDVNKLITIAKDMNLKAIRRIINAVIESPLQKENLTLLSDKEKKLFILFDSLLTNCYYGDIKIGLEKQRNGEEINSIEDLIIHTITDKDLQKREKVEQDAFNTGNKLLACKFLMMFQTITEFLEKESKNVILEKGSKKWLRRKV